MAKFKVGDRVRVCNRDAEIVGAWRDTKDHWAIRYLDDKTCGVDFGSNISLASPADSPDQYIGGAIDDLPGGAVFDAAWRGDGVVARQFWDGNKCHSVDKDDRPILGQGRMPQNFGPVIRIHKLGEPRPKTLGECPVGEWWDDCEGDANAWFCRDNENRVYIYYPGSPCVSVCDFTASEKIVRDNWTRLGPIEGIVIGGKVYGKGAVRDESH